MLGKQEGEGEGEARHTEEEDGDGEGDVSLITGKVRTAAKASELHSEGQLTVINDKTIRYVGLLRIFVFIELLLQFGS